MAKKIPYGLTDYLRIVTEDYYYVDKTRYIEDLEKTAAFLFLIRPRRFGKSLFLNMLYCYYDVSYSVINISANIQLQNKVSICTLFQFQCRSWNGRGVGGKLQHVC